MSHPKHADTDHDVHELIRSRWSPRAFDANRAVPRAELLRLFEAARWSPSSGNEQPWHFIVVPRDESSASWRGLTAALTGSNPTWAAAAPVLIVTVVRRRLETKDADNPMAFYDAGQAVALMVVQATAQGLSVRQMAGFRHADVRAACQIPDGFDPIVVSAVGYAGDPEGLPNEKHRASERQPRRRKAVADFVYENAWGNALGEVRS
jgi:nitroreductase